MIKELKKNITRKNELIEKRENMLKAVQAKRVKIVKEINDFAPWMAEVIKACRENKVSVYFNMASADKAVTYAVTVSAEGASINAFRDVFSSVVLLKSTICGHPGQQYIFTQLACSDINTGVATIDTVFDSTGKITETAAHLYNNLETFKEQIIEKINDALEKQISEMEKNLKAEFGEECA